MRLYPTTRLELFAPPKLVVTEHDTDIESSEVCCIVQKRNPVYYRHSGVAQQRERRLSGLAPRIPSSRSTPSALVLPIRPLLRLGDEVLDAVESGQL